MLHKVEQNNNDPVVLSLWGMGVGTYYLPWMIAVVLGALYANKLMEYRASKHIVLWC